MSPRAFSYLLRSCCRHLVRFTFNKAIKGISTIKGATARFGCMRVLRLLYSTSFNFISATYSSSYFPNGFRRLAACNYWLTPRFVVAPIHWVASITYLYIDPLYIPFMHLCHTTY